MLAARLLLITLTVFLLAPPALAQEAEEPAAPAEEEEVPAEPEVNPLVTEAEELAARIDEITRDEDDLDGRERRAHGEERTVLMLQLRKRRIEVIRTLGALASNVAAQEEQGLDASEYRARAEKYAGLVEVGAPRLVNELEQRIANLRAEREGAEGEAAAKIQEQLTAANESLDETFGLFLDHLAHRETLGLSADRSRDELARQIRQHAEALTGRLELASTRNREAAARAAEVPGDAALAQAQVAARTELDATAARLTQALDIMEEIDLDTARYHRALIQATGQITSEVLDTEVASGLLEDAGIALRDWWQTNGPVIAARIFVFFLVLLGFWLLAGLTRRVVQRTITRPGVNLSALARDMVIRLTGRLIMLIGLFVALSQLGVQVGALLAGLGIAGFIVGFALQDSLGNFASGALILIYRPYDVGDVIEAGGVRGRVSHMTLVSTTILTFDNETLVVPNSKIWGDVIKNVTNQKIRRVDMTFRTSFEQDVVAAEALFASILKEHPKVLDDPEPLIKVKALGDSAVEFAVNPWVETDDYWTVFWDIHREVKIRFDREGLEVPPPRVRVLREPEPDGSR